VARLQETQHEVDRLKNRLGQFRKKPEELRQDIQTLEREVADLEREIEQLNGQVRDRTQVRKRRLAEELKAKLDDCRRLLDMHERDRHMELLRDAQAFLRENGGAEVADLSALSPREVKRTLSRYAADRERVREYLRSRLADTNQQVAAAGGMLEELASLEQQEDSLNDEIKALRESILVEHEVEPPALDSLKNLRDDPEFLYFCTERSADASREHEWMVPGDPFAELRNHSQSKRG